MTCIVKGEGVKKHVRINTVFDKYLVICYINIYTLQIIPLSVSETEMFKTEGKPQLRRLNGGHSSLQTSSAITKIGLIYHLGFLWVLNILLYRYFETLLS